MIKQRLRLFKHATFLAPGKTARSKPAFPDEILTPCLGHHLVRRKVGKKEKGHISCPDEILTPCPVRHLVRMKVGKKAPFLVRVSSGAILTPFLVRLDLNPNKISSGSILTLIGPRPGLIRLNFNPISCPA